MNKILIIEDDLDIQLQMKWGLSKDLIILQAYERKPALLIFEKKLPKVVILDLGLPPDKNGTSEGFICLKEIMEQVPDTKVIVITENENRGNSLKAFQIGCYDYLIKPVDLNKLKLIIERAFYLSEIADEVRNLHKVSENIALEGMIGQCPQMTKVFDIIKIVSTTNAPVLLTGESGTGKRLAAKIIHEKSLRNKEDFFLINCGVIPDNFLKSDFFSHDEDNLFNSNKQQRNKYRGILFLDEISKMSFEYQTVLMEFLERQKLQNGNENQDIKSDVRLIAATKFDLHEAVKGNKFREDLFYRLSVITINLPPLRERGEDIMLLASVFLERYSATVKKKIRGFSPEVINAIKSYSWPGNIRELENKIHGAVIMSGSGFIEPNDLDLAEAQPVTQTDNKYENITLREARKRFEIEFIEMNINKYRGNIKHAARELGISRPTLYDLITKYGLNEKYNLK